MLLEEHKATKVYRFQLRDETTDDLRMNTEVDEPDPRADLEFWKDFMTGNYVMSYEGTGLEIDKPDTTHFSQLYCMATDSRRACINAINGLDTKYAVVCTENNHLTQWATMDDFDSARLYAEDFVMRRESPFDQTGER